MRNRCSPSHPLKTKRIWGAAGVLVGLLGFALALAGADSRALAAPAPAAAEPEKPPPEYRFELGLSGGYHIFHGDSSLGPAADDPDLQDLVPTSAALLGGRFTLNFNRWLAVEGEIDLSRSKTRNGAATLGIYGYRGHLLLNLATGAFRPFLLAGYGAFTSVSSDANVVPNDTDGNMHLGGGFKIYFHDRAGLRLDARVHVPAAFASKQIPTGDDANPEALDFVAMGSLFFTLSEIISIEKRFTEKSVVVMKTQPAPPPPPPPPPPPADPDKDGIAGAADKCPTVPEDSDGFEDSDGCPEPDNDGDGIADAEDKCPVAAETRNGIDDEDGCPEEDADADGFIGSNDKCPGAPETRNNYKDEDGCPDEVPAAVKRFTGVIDGINFRTRSAEILPGSYTILERAIAVLEEYKDVRIEISGHTDSQGSDSYNKALSYQRAESVRQFFVLRGITAERLTAIGHGEERPIADNMSAAGRGQNRRTEFRLLGGP